MAAISSSPRTGTLVSRPRISALSRMARFVIHAVRVVEGRRQLTAMDARMLSDIGISRAEALAEADRAPWDLHPPPVGHGRTIRQD